MLSKSKTTVDLLTGKMMKFISALSPTNGKNMVGIAALPLTHTEEPIGLTSLSSIGTDDEIDSTRSIHHLFTGEYSIAFGPTAKYEPTRCINFSKNFDINATSDQKKPLECNDNTIQIEPAHENPVSLSVVLGYGSYSEHSNCVVIGTGIHSTENNQVMIGNSTVLVSRTLTDDEYLTLRNAIINLFISR